MLTNFLSILLIAIFFNIISCSINEKPQLRPNIVLFITDDQDVELGSMAFMPKTLKMMRDRGATFSNAFVSTPICCPSRSTILTGLYVHNHNVQTNNANCSGKEWREVHEQRTFASYLKNFENYRTGYFGKYLNDYDGSYVPNGWDHWMGLVKNSRFYNYTLNINGKLRRHGFDYEKDYLTDLITNETINFVEQTVTSHLQSSFLAVLAFPAPHGPEDPAPQYAKMFDGVETHRTAAWNYAPNPDKQWLLQRTGKMEPVHVVFTDFLHRRRLQTLQSVDDALHRVLAYLRMVNELQNTYVIFTSDHGYHLGQFGLIKGKNMPYEFDIKVPFFIRGPTIPRGLIVNQIVSNIDIAPTILAISGITTPDHMDGRSILDLLAAELSPIKSMKLGLKMNVKKSWRHTLLIERGKMPKLRRIEERIERLRSRFNKTARIEAACSRPEFLAACSGNQNWQCVRSKAGTWRIRKCRVGKISCACSKHFDVSNRTRRDSSLAGAHNEEEEFLRDLEQQDVVESGKWFQGVFHVMPDKMIGSTPSNQSLNKSKPRRDKREANFYKITAEIKEICSNNNYTFCKIADETLIESHEEYWLKNRHKINKKIKALKTKLSTFREMRKVMRLSEHLDSSNVDIFLSNSSSPVDTCDCEKHPVIDFHTNFTKVLPNESKPADFLKAAKRRRHWLRANSVNSSANGATNSKDFSESFKCNVAQMNCFHHSSTHWRTPPFWPLEMGEFCFCQNANNNSYWCLRTVNETHNFLYCEFVTEFVSYYNLNADPYQLYNIVYELELPILEQLSSQLRKLKQCSTSAECEHYSSLHWHSPLLPKQRGSKKYT